MPQSARIWTTACPKPAGPLKDYEREYDRVTRSASPLRSRYTEPSSFPPSCTVQRPGFLIGSRSGCWSGFTNAACAPSLASNGKTTCQTKMSSREPACPAILLQVQLRRAGHISRMEDVRMPKTVFFNGLQEGKRDRGASRKRYKDQPKRQLAQAEICYQSWQHEASDRDSWCSSVRKASRKFKQRHEAAKEKLRRQKERTASLSSSTQIFVYPECSRVCASRIGFYSHQVACKN